MMRKVHRQAEDEETVYWLEPTLAGRLRAAASWLLAVMCLMIAVSTGPAGFPHGLADALLALFMLQLVLFLASRFSKHNRRAWGNYEPGWGNKIYLVELLAMGITCPVALLSAVTRLFGGWVWLSSPAISVTVFVICATPLLVFGLLMMRVGRQGR